MKLLALIIALFICQVAICQVDKALLIGDWISVEYRQSNTIDNEPFSGFILSFNENEMEYYSLWDDSTRILTYNELDSIEKVSNSAFFQFVSRDSLIIGDRISSILYYPMKSSKSKSTKEQFERLLIDKNWKLDDTTLTHIKFVDYLPTDVIPRRVETYFVVNKNGFFQYADYWFTFLFKGNLFFTITFKENFKTYHIISIENEKVEFNCYSKNTNQPFYLQSEPKLNETRYSDLKRNISGKLWKSIEKTTNLDDDYDRYWELYHIIDSTKVEILPNILKHSENYPNYLKYYVFSTSFSFSENGDYKIFKRKKIYDEGKWELSSDGMFLILNPKTKNEFYLRIIEISETEMVIAQTLALNFNKKSEERGIVNFLVRMKN